MKHLEDIVFADRSFPIKIVPNRSSVISLEAARAFHESVEIKYFYEGESTLLIGSEILKAKAGDIIVINPYEFHATLESYSDSNGKYHLFMIGIDFFEGAVGAAIDLRRLLFDRGVVLRRRVENCDAVRAILDRMVAETNCPKDTYRLSIFGLTAELFSHLLLEAYDTKNPSKDRAINYTAIEPAIIMIMDRFSENITLDELARVSRMSKYHFCRSFKEIMGMGAIEYLNQHRLKLADALLKSTDKPISEIASSVGYADSGYFSRIYKRKYGKTPRCAKNHS